MNWRRLGVYLLLNALVSALVTTTVLVLWDTFRGEAPAVARPPTQLQSTDSASGDTLVAQVQASATPTLYEVTFGDTLGSISLQYDVSVNDIMAANGLTDPNSLQVGQVLVIPVDGLTLPTATPAALLLPTSNIAPPATSTVTVQQAEPQLSIRNVTDAGNLATEKVTLVNLGGPVDLAGWSLRDADGNAFQFPVLNLFQGGAVSVHTGLGRDTVTDLYWGQGAAVWRSGETITVLDPQGVIRATAVVP